MPSIAEVPEKRSLPACRLRPDRTSLGAPKDTLMHQDWPSTPPLRASTPQVAIVPLMNKVPSSVVDGELVSLDQGAMMIVRSGSSDEAHSTRAVPLRDASKHMLLHHHRHALAAVVRHQMPERALPPSSEYYRHSAAS
ncbi:hypothetical protein AC578_5518 [Pseudocercospora eumusae]|uniref:Uncharacterized protein n=1 Tax=Pseudocercospora eumusae TaxID=321146 RepID=A0A139H861_9PEZI|nr:hypothetical protein AC578_5518 [Pseudocercospora eumusae]